MDELEDSLKRSNRPPYTSDPTYYEQLNDELGHYYYHPSITKGL